jgi:hypothetical protein
MPVAAAEMLGIYKEFYTPDKMEQLLWRNSSLVKKLEKMRVTGKTYNYPVLSGMGGAVSGNGATAVAQSTTTARTQQSAATYQQIFSAFQLTEKEVLASQNEKGAFEPAGVVKMFAACEAARKTFGACAYSMGFGEVGTVVGAVMPAGVTMVVDDATLVKIDVGTVFCVTDGSIGLPSDPLLGAPDTYTITKIDSDGSGVNTVTFTPGAIAGVGFTNGAWICLNGGRSGAATPLMPIGLTGIIPKWFNRTGGAWGTYIGTAFYGVDRSTSVSRLAGGFVLRNTGAGEKRYQAITRAVKLARRQGSEADLIVMNDNDYANVVNELEADRNYWQALNTGGKSSPNEVVVGMEQMGYQAATSWVKTVIDDPYCPCFSAYVLETRTMKFVALSNVERATQDGIADNSPGAPPITKDGDTPTNQYALLIEDILTLNPLTVGQDGPGLQALLSVFGTYVVQNPAHCVAVNLVS